MRGGGMSAWEKINRIIGKHGKGKGKKEENYIKKRGKGHVLGYKISSYKVGTVITILKNQ